MHTYILELDIMGLTPGSAWGRAAVYSAWVWRSLGPAADSGAAGVRRVVMADGGRVRAARSTRSLYCPRILGDSHLGVFWSEVKPHPDRLGADQRRPVVLASGQGSEGFDPNLADDSARFAAGPSHGSTQGFDPLAHATQPQPV